MKPTPAEIRALRQVLGEDDTPLSQRQFAARIHLSPKSGKVSVSRWETGYCTPHRLVASSINRLLRRHREAVDAELARVREEDASGLSDEPKPD